eukprot:17590-Chlamydomonas_euryale.AAC.3
MPVLSAARQRRWTPAGPFSRATEARRCPTCTLSLRACPADTNTPSLWSAACYTESASDRSSACCRKWSWPAWGYRLSQHQVCSRHGDPSVSHAHVQPPDTYTHTSNNSAATLQQPFIDSNQVLNAGPPRENRQ